MKERTLALAGVFQAAELVRQAANHGTWSGYAASASLRSLFRLETASVADVFGDRSQVRLGTETLLAVLQGENRYTETLRYAVGLLQVEKKFRRAEKVQQTIGNRLEEISAGGEALEEHEREDLQVGQISRLYSETISNLSPRIVVNGKPQYLKNERTIEWIRALLLAGLRSATLWQQLGGNRFELMFRRKQIMREAQTLLLG
ncbi:MAG: high frequency lysogenization protein HflD [Xanthomonadales bacterium]|nr:high frequency lysogenization protein HflD [Xanthomonadales bacterium]